MDKSWRSIVETVTIVNNALLYTLQFAKRVDLMIRALIAKVNNKEGERRLLEGMNMFMALIVVTMMRTYLHLIKLCALTVFYMSVQFSSGTQSCPTLCDPMNRSTPGLPVHHQLLEFTQTHVHWVGDAIQPSYPLSSPYPPAPNPSQHQSFPMSQCQSYLIKWFKKKGISVVGIAQALCSRQNWFWISVLTLADMNKMIFKIPPLCRILVGRYGLSSWC